MTEIVLFHSVLGLRPGVTDAAERLRSAGHLVHTPDLYDGKVFDDYTTALEWVESIGGIPELISRTQAAVAELPEAVVYAGFSNGGASAELLAATRPGARGAVLLHAALPLAAFGASAWPEDVPVQVHYAADDPFREQELIDAFAASVRDSGASYEFFEYPVSGHLITDPSLPEEYHQESAEMLFARVLEFLERIDRG
ncbi:dienelactone hydrolase family protein [Streptomyces sp. NPDC002851]